MPGTITPHAWVWPSDVELRFREAGVPRDRDLLVIDIDGDADCVRRAIRDCRPKGP